MKKSGDTSPDAETAAFPARSFFTGADSVVCLAFDWGVDTVEEANKGTIITEQNRSWDIDEVFYYIQQVSLYRI